MVAPGMLDGVHCKEELVHGEAAVADAVGPPQAPLPADATRMHLFVPSFELGLHFGMQVHSC
jgi:hypothetical protein